MSNQQKEKPVPDKSRKIVEFLGLKRSMVALLTMVILVGLGEKMAERFLPIYLMALGGGAYAIGLLNGMDNLLGALYAYPGGYLSDRFGYKRALIIFNLIALTGYLIVIFFPYWIAVIIGAALFLSWTAISLPASMSLVSNVLPLNKRTMGVSLHSFMRRIPMALGPIIGGTFITLYGVRSGIRIAFGIAFILGVISLVVQEILIEDTRTGEKAEISPLRMFRFMQTSLKWLLLSDILVRFCEQIPYAFVVVWCLKNVGISAADFGFLTAIEMVTAMVIYIPIAYFADRSSKKPFVVITFLFFSAFPLVLIFSHTFPMLVFAFIIRGLKEFGEPTRKALIMDLAPEGKKAGIFGLYYLIRDVIVSFAAFGGAYFWEISPKTNFIVAFGFGILGTLVFARFGRDLSGK